MSPAPRPLPRQGIALTVGLAATRHLDHVWAVLEQFGRSTPIRWSLNSFSPKVLALRPLEAWTADRDAGPPWGGGSRGQLGGKAVGHGPRPPAHLCSSGVAPVPHFPPPQWCSLFPTGLQGAQL